MNNIGVRLIVCCFLAVSSVGLSHAKNRALLIGISEYSPKYQWNSISGTNDIDLIKGVLKDFSIKELRNKNATFANITKELERLIAQSNPNDVVYIHFSGHGQPIEDYLYFEQGTPYCAAAEMVMKQMAGTRHLFHTMQEINTSQGCMKEKNISLMIH